MKHAKLILGLLFMLSAIACGTSDPPSAPSSPRDSSSSIIVIDSRQKADEVVDELPEIPVEDEDVEEPPGPNAILPPEIPVENDKLRVDDRVIVTNTGDARLFIRDPAGFEEDRRNVIGSAADGATGIVLEGPLLGDGFSWYRIEWDANEKVAFKEGVPCCIGWSAETNEEGNIRYLTKIK